MLYSPGELVREKFLTLLADPEVGLNPAFLTQCQLRGIDPPMPGAAGQPGQIFDFRPNSAQVFRMMEDMDWLDRNTEAQYPAMIAYVHSVNQFGEYRIFGSLFHGEVVLEANVFIAWPTIQGPAGNNFETHLDALELSFLTVLNNPDADWLPAVFSNVLDFPKRFPLTLCNQDQLLRRGLQVRLAATVVI